VQKSLVHFAARLQVLFFGVSWCWWQQQTVSSSWHFGVSVFRA